MENLLYWVLAAAAVFVVLKFILKPMLKLFGLVIVGVAVWWFLGDDIAAWLSSMS